MVSFTNLGPLSSLTRTHRERRVLSRRLVRSGLASSGHDETVEAEVEGKGGREGGS